MCSPNTRPTSSGAILHREVLTPVDLEREFHLTGGNIFHGRMTLDQMFSMRPVPGFADYRTPIRGLYHVWKRDASRRWRHGTARAECGWGDAEGRSGVVVDTLLVTMSRGVLAVSPESHRTGRASSKLSIRTAAHAQGHGPQRGSPHGLRATSHFDRRRFQRRGYYPGKDSALLIRAA